MVWCGVVKLGGLAFALSKRNDTYGLLFVLFVI